MVLPPSGRHGLRTSLLRFADRRPWGAAGLFITFVFLTANHPLLRQVGVGRWDVDGQFYPFFTLVADHARQARVLLWDPFSAGGLPALGEPQIGSFSPVTILSGLVFGGGAYGFVLYWLLVWWLGGIGMLLLARHLAAPAWVGAVVAIGYLFSGVYTGNAQHTSWVVGFSAIPFVIWRIDASIRTGRWMPAVQAGALWGLSGLSAHPSLVILTGGMAILWVAGRASSGADDRDPVTGSASAVRMTSPVRRAANTVLLFVGIGVLVLSPAYFAFFYEGAGTHSRVGALTRAVALSNQFDPGALITLATPWPTSVAVMLQGGLFPSSDPSMTNIYMGVLIPILAVFALISRPRSAWRWFLLGLAVFSLSAAMGEALPLRGWLYDLFVPLRYFRHSGVFRLYFVFFISTLAVLGGGDLARAVSAREARDVRRFSAAAMATATIAILVTVHFTWRLWEDGIVGRRSMVHAVGWVLVIIALAVVRRVPASRRTVVAAVLAVTLAAADALASGAVTRSTTTASGEAVRRWQDLDARHSTSLDLLPQGLARVASSCDAPSARCRRNDQLITKYQSFDPYTTQRHHVHLAMLQDTLLRSVAVGETRVWFADSVVRLPATEESFRAFVAAAHTSKAVPLVIHDPPSMREPFTAPGGGSSGLDRLPGVSAVPAELLAYGMNQLSLRVTAPRAGWIMVSDRWARSWQARVNGTEVPLYGGNFIFRAVAVSAGASRIDFVYRPVYSLGLLAVSWSVLAAVLAASIGSARVSRCAVRP